MIKQHITKLLDTEMDRKDFLKLLGVGAVAAVGISGIIKAMTQQPVKPTAKTADGGYGSTAYGGSKDSKA